jgi:hypothetical protein
VTGGNLGALTNDSIQNSSKTIVNAPTAAKAGLFHSLGGHFVVTTPKTGSKKVEKRLKRPNKPAEPKVIIQVLSTTVNWWPVSLKIKFRPLPPHPNSILNLAFSAKTLSLSKRN